MLASLETGGMLLIFDQMKSVEEMLGLYHLEILSTQMKSQPEGNILNIFTSLYWLCMYSLLVQAKTMKCW